jgi:hypothetical protein
MSEQMQGEKEQWSAQMSEQLSKHVHSARRGCQYRRRTRVRRVVVELASLHPLEAKGVPAQRRVRHELRLELADGDRRLPTAETAAIVCDRSAAPTKVTCRDLLFSAGRRGARMTNININIIVISIT